VEKQGKQRRQAFTPEVKKTLVKVLVGIAIAVASREIGAAMPGRGRVQHRRAAPHVAQVAERRPFVVRRQDWRATPQAKTASQENQEHEGRARGSCGAHVDAGTASHRSSGARESCGDSCRASCSRPGDVNHVGPRIATGATKEACRQIVC